MPERTTRVRAPETTTIVPVNTPSEEAALPHYRWIKLAKHCRLTGDTPDAVHARRRKRIWRDGVQCTLGPDGNLYVDPQEWNKWVESRTPSPRSPAA